VQEFSWGASIRRKNTGTDFLTALIGLVGRNKRRYGGYIVHVGIVLMFIGFAGGAYKKDEQTSLKLGQQFTVGKYTIRNDGIKVSDDGARQMTTAYLSVFENGKQIDSMYPARWAFRKHEDTPTTEVAIRRGFGEDLYVVMPSNDPATVASQVAPLEIIINPLVDWIWLGFGVIAFGTGIALLPERAYSFAVAKLPVEAATTAVLVLGLILGGAPRARAQAGMPPGADSSTQTSHYPRTDFEKQMQHEIVCTCGCGHVSIAECRKDPCATSHQMRGELAGMLDRGLNRDQIKAEFISSYGNEEMIAQPIPKGFR